MLLVREALSFPRRQPPHTGPAPNRLSADLCSPWGGLRPVAGRLSFDFQTTRPKEIQKPNSPITRGGLPAWKLSDRRYRGGAPCECDGDPARIPQDAKLACLRSYN